MRVAKLAQFEVYRDNALLFRWQLRDDANRILAESSEGYHNRSDCENAVSLVRSIVPNAKIVLNNT